MLWNFKVTTIKLIFPKFVSKLHNLSYSIAHEYIYEPLFIQAKYFFIGMSFAFDILRVSVQGVESLWGDCRFIPADWGSQ